MLKTWERRECDDCKSLGPRGQGLAMFALKDSVWQSVARRDEVLCFLCTEKRLGRNITAKDLAPCANSDILLLGIEVGKR